MNHLLIKLARYCILYMLYFCVHFFFFFFFSSRRRHTRFDCDWSSDVLFRSVVRQFETVVAVESGIVTERLHEVPRPDVPPTEIGRASCRERVQISVVAVSLKKKRGARLTMEHYI